MSIKISFQGETIAEVNSQLIAYLATTPQTAAATPAVIEVQPAVVPVPAAAQPVIVPVPAAAQPVIVPVPAAAQPAAAPVTAALAPVPAAAPVLVYITNDMKDALNAALQAKSTLGVAGEKLFDLCKKYTGETNLQKLQQLDMEAFKAELEALV